MTKPHAGASPDDPSCTGSNPSLFPDPRPNIHSGSSSSSGRSATSNASSGPRASTQPSRGVLPILQATTDQIRWFVPLLNGLPRDQQFDVCDRINTNLDTVLRGPTAARLDLLRIQTRLLHDFQRIDFQRINTRRYEHASRLLEAVARQLSGWLHQRRRPPA
jgi:hypothetical protein